LRGDEGGYREREDLAPSGLPPDRGHEGHGGEHVDHSHGGSGDARPVERADQRHIDQRRAEAGKAAHQSGQHRDSERQHKARIRDRGGKGSAVREKIDHEECPAKGISYQLSP